jgi:hypothetical protein
VHAPTEEKALAFQRAFVNKRFGEDGNFIGAWFPLDLNNSNFGGHVFSKSADFRMAYFNGDADFSAARFERDAFFNKAHFNQKLIFDSAQFNGEADFSSVEVSGETDFTSVRVEKNAGFSGALFYGKTRFHAILIGGRTGFHKAKFHGKADFISSHFREDVSFNEAIFNVDADFTSARFDSNIDFSSAQLRGEAEFNSAEIIGRTNFSAAEFFGDAYFSPARFGAETNFRIAKFHGDCNFGSAVFAREAGFGGARFEGNAYFSKAKFKRGVVFDTARFAGDANFKGARFDAFASFNTTRFNAEAIFKEAIFGENTDFSAAQFMESAYFEKSVFSKNLKFFNAVFHQDCLFINAIFKSAVFADFGQARFMDLARFMKNTIDEGAEFYFGETTFEKPEHVYFHSLKMQTRWFINVDIRKFNFENIVFPILQEYIPTERELPKAGQMLQRLEEIRGNTLPDDIAEPRELLITVYRRLADNAEENKRFEEASNFRYIAMELARGGVGMSSSLKNLSFRILGTVKSIDKYSKDFTNLFFTKIGVKSAGSFNPLLWLYWLSSGYGERSWRAFMVLLYIWVIFALFYMSPWFCSFDPLKPGTAPQTKTAAAEESKKQPESLFFGEALAYSFAVVALQKPEPKPLGPFTYGLVLMETVLGPVQAALLALAIRRKFMR